MKDEPRKEIEIMKPVNLAKNYNEQNFKKEGLGCVGPVEGYSYA